MPNFDAHLFEVACQFPVPAAPPADQRAIERLVRRLLALRGQGPEAVALEQELNERIYRLFELTDEEIALIEESLGRQTARSKGSEQ